MRDRAIAIVFFILIAFGLSCGFLYSINLDLNSDTVVPGLVSMELFKHGNIQYTYPVDDPYLFTDIYPFYLVTQFLSGFNPMVLRLTAFFIFLLVVAVFSYIVYQYSGLANALILAALLVNISPAAYGFFITPEYHVGSLLAAGVLVYLFDFERVKNVSFNRILAYILIVSLILLSDTILLVMFIVPYVACYLLFYRNYLKRSIPTKKSSRLAAKDAGAWSMKDIKKVDMAMIVMVVASAVTWLFKTYEPFFLYQFICLNPRPTGFAGIYQALFVNIPLFIQCIACLINQGLFNVLSIQFSLLDIPVAIVFLLTLIFAAIRRNDRANYLYLMFLLSGIVTLLGFIFLDRADGLWSARFVNFIAVAAFIVISLAYNVKIKDNDILKDPRLNVLFLIAVIVPILSTVPFNLQKVASLDYQPNQADYELIDYLKANNLTHGYSDFENSNKLTYLSNEEVEIRTINIYNNQLKALLYTWLSSARWYSGGVYPEPAIIVNKNTTFYNDMQAIINLHPEHPPTDTYYYKDYVIYVMPSPK